MSLYIGYILSIMQPESMDLKYELFNEIDKSDSIFKNASKTEVLEIEKNYDNTKEEKEVNIKIKVLENNDITLEKGTYPMIVKLRKNENNTYKISSIGF